MSENAKPVMTEEENLAIIKNNYFGAEAPVVLHKLIGVSRQGVIIAVLNALKEMESVKSLNLPENCQFSVEFGDTEEHFLNFFFYTITDPNWKPEECDEGGCDCGSEECDCEKGEEENV